MQRAVMHSITNVDVGIMATLILSYPLFLPLVILRYVFEHQFVPPLSIKSKVNRLVLPSFGDVTIHDIVMRIEFNRLVLSNPFFKMVLCFSG